MESEDYTIVKNCVKCHNQILAKNPRKKYCLGCIAQLARDRAKDSYYAKAAITGKKHLSVISCQDCNSKVKQKAANQIRCKPCQHKTNPIIKAENSKRKRLREGKGVLCKNICKICGRDFEKKAHNHTICSNECKSEHLRRVDRKRYYAYKKEKDREYCKARRKSDPKYSIIIRTRGLIASGFRKRNFPKGDSTLAMLGVDSWAEFLNHLERQFLAGMTWESRGKWQIDHIVPLGSAETADDVMRLNHFSNLRPMWASDNMAKGAKQTMLI